MKCCSMNAVRHILRLPNVIVIPSPIVLLNAECRRTTHYLEEAERLSDRVAIMDRGRIVAIGTSDEIIDSFGSGERLDVRGGEELARYLRDKTKLHVIYKDAGLISISLDQKHDAYTAIAAIEESGLPWSGLQTRRDSLEDVFVKLVGGALEEYGEVEIK